MVWTIWDEVDEKDWEEWEKTYDEMELYEEARELAKAWIRGLENLECLHPRVARKVLRNVVKWSKANSKLEAFTRLAEELLRRRQKRPQLQSVKIALTYTLYRYHVYGSVVKLYANGSVVYRDHSCFKDLSFIIHDGKEVS